MTGLNTLYSDLTKHNENLCKRIILLTEIIGVYKKALLDLQAHPVAKAALEEARIKEKKK